MRPSIRLIRTGWINDVTQPLIDGAGAGSRFLTVWGEQCHIIHTILTHLFQIPHDQQICSTVKVRRGDELEVTVVQLQVGVTQTDPACIFSHKTAFRLAEDLVQLDHRQCPAGNQLAQHGTGPNGGQLIRVADQYEPAVERQRMKQVPGQQHMAAL